MVKATAFATLLLPVVIFSSFISAPEAQTQAEGVVPISIVVTAVEADSSSSLTKQNVVVYSGRNHRDVTSWIPAQGDKAALQLAILVDTLDSAVGVASHLDDLREFVVSQPISTQVGIFYSSNGSAKIVSEFTADHEAVARKLKLPLGRTGGDTSGVYPSLRDLISHWPPSEARREVLVLANGIDRLQPGVDSSNVTSVAQNYKRKVLSFLPSLPRVLGLWALRWDKKIWLS